MIDYSAYTVEELEKAEAELALQRTAVRESQNAVAAELAIKRAVEAMPEAARNVLTLRLGGSLPAAGEAKSAGGKG